MTEFKLHYIAESKKEVISISNADSYEYAELKQSTSCSHEQKVEMIKSDKVVKEILDLACVHYDKQETEDGKKLNHGCPIEAISP